MDVDEREGVLWITFDRPDVLNAFTTETAVELAEAVAGADPAVHDAVVLTGEGDAFSAGGDVEAMAERREKPADAYDRLGETFGRLVEECLDCPVPIVARVNGDAVGAGLAIVALADFAYAVDDARFSCAFVRVGLIPDTGGTFVLPHLIGLRAAKRLAFTGELVDAREAAELGLINGTVAADALDDRIDELLGTLSGLPTRTIGLTKRAFHENLGRGATDALDYENLLQVQAYGSDAHAEGVEAFLEKRDPEFD